MLRRWLIWTHRYVGVPMSALFVLWFASGIVMMYTGDMPRLAPEARLERLAPLDLSQVRLPPSAAAARGSARQPPGRATLLTVLGRPAYRFDDVTVFADTGERLSPLGLDDARKVARQFSGQPDSAIRYDGLVTQPDQWTLVVRPALPAHKFRVDDDAHTQVYVSQRTADVAMVTTRRTRLLAWLGAIPHWFYLPSLRIDRPLWESVIVWTSAVGCLIAVTGLLLGAIQFRWRQPRGGRSRIPYVGLMRWHYLSGVIFGAVTLSWIFSGLLSVQPFAWMTAGGMTVSSEMTTGGPLRLSDFGAIDRSDWQQVTSGRVVKEAALLTIEGAPHYDLWISPGPDDAPGHDRLLLAADTLAPRRRPISVEMLTARLRAALPGVEIVDAVELATYDAYYYGRGSERPPLPAVRVEFADWMKTWVYVDARTGRLVHRAHRYERLERWLFNGLHSLDFAFWYDRRPLWDIGVMVLMLGGLASSGIGLWVGAGRVRRAIGRWS